MNSNDEKNLIVDCYRRHGTWNEVSSVLNIPLRTLKRKRAKLNTDDDIKITDNELHNLVSKVNEEQPLAGRLISTYIVNID